MFLFIFIKVEKLALFFQKVILFVFYWRLLLCRTPVRRRLRNRQFLHPVSSPKHRHITFLLPICASLRRLEARLRVHGFYTHSEAPKSSIPLGYAIANFCTLSLRQSIALLIYKPKVHLARYSLRRGAEGQGGWIFPLAIYKIIC